MTPAQTSPSCRHRAARKGFSGSGASGRGRGGGNSDAGRLRRLVLVLAVALAWTRPNSLLAEAVCQEGLEGILSSNGEICCLDACGQCGGTGCSDIAGTEETDCCIADIEETGVVCGVDGAVAPCIIDTTLTPSPTMAASTAPPAAAATDQPSLEGTTAQPANTEPTATLAPTATGTTTTAPVVPPAAVTAAPAATRSPTPFPMTLAPTPFPTTTTTVVPATLAPVATAAPVTAPTTAAPVTAPVETVAPTPGVSSTCDNGYPGWQSQEACCTEFCGQCGGSGCGALGSADCCLDNIMTAGVVCGVDTFEAPCIVPVLGEGETYAPVGAPTPPTVAPAPSTTTPGTAAPEAGVAAPTLAPSASREIGGATEAPSATGTGGGGINPTGTPVALTSAPDGTAPVGTAAPMGAAAPVGTAAPIVQECADGIAGIPHDIVCCPVACGQCGGSGCENIEGTAGESDCCSDAILISGQTCEETGGVSPCILNVVDAVSGATDTEDASAARSSTRMSGVAEGGRGVAWAIAALSAAGFAMFNQP